MKTSMRIKRVKRISETEFEIELESRTRTTFKIGKKIREILEELARLKGMTIIRPNSRSLKGRNSSDI